MVVAKFDVIAFKAEVICKCMNSTSISIVLYAYVALKGS